MAVDIRASFTAADAIPVKVLLDRDLWNATRRGIITPIHLQIMPTNTCNQNCPFCSCAARDKSQVMPLEMAREIITMAVGLGTKAVTITGGGEPLCYPWLDELIACFATYHVKVGLVTNGLLLHKVSADTLKKVTWCRISSGDDRSFDTRYQARLERAVWSAPSVDWAFSHVITATPNLLTIGRLVDFANRNKFTHVRLVADIFVPETVDMEFVRSSLAKMKIDDCRVVYQARNQPTKGGDCYICYLKPVIGPDAKVYTCCGAQYAFDPPPHDMPKELCLGDARDLESIIANSRKPFDGSICSRCYYSQYNLVLRTMLSEIKHAEFV